MASIRLRASERNAEIPTAWLEEAFAFAVANGWRPPATEDANEQELALLIERSERPTLPAPPPEAMKLGLVRAA